MSGGEGVILPALMGGEAAVASAGIPAFLSAALDSAAIGGLGSLLMGQNPLQGALFGGLTGGALNAIAPQGLGSLFGGSGVNPSLETTAGALSGGLENAPNLNLSLAGAGTGASSAAGSLYPNSVASQFTAGAAPAAASSAAASNPSFLSRFGPYAATAGGAMLLDRAMAPDEIGPPMAERPRNPGPVSPLNRQAQSVDPDAYYGSGGNRNFYSPYSLRPQFMAGGGGVGLGARKGYANGGSSSASSSNIPPMGRRGMVKGGGTGQSDSVPAMLSDGEFVVSAPVVSALGGGSNNAGAKKLSALQKNVLKKHYTGGKPRKAAGLGSYMH